MSRIKDIKDAVASVEERSVVTAPPPHRARVAKRVALALGLLAGAAGAGYLGHEYWTTGRFLVSTNDAYVQADSTTIAPKVSGYIVKVLVNDNERVRTGQLLAQIDDRDYRTALDQARANVSAADAAVGNLNAQISLQQASIAEAAAQVDATRASLLFATQDAKRYAALVPTPAGSLQLAQQSESKRSQLAAQLQHDQAAFLAAQRQVAVLTTARDQASAQADQVRAAEHQAELNLTYTTIAAPMDGTVGDRTLRVGQYVTAGTQLMAVVPLHSTYVVANFKETQLADVRSGQAAQVAVDGLNGRSFAGHVDSLSPASGLAFALLPPDNATGNFTKIVQRIPVKILLDDPAAEGALRVGMSVEPTINTKPAPPPHAVASAATSGRG
ncbi:MAG TPA: HlyD family secretion protein [Acetobacteraceae bacterium]|nr:HlyD family secretion protein [Acetobacteraceae bacterium]